MTIQLPVVLWTVICFVGVMLILHNLLFKPVLKVMDERSRRIERASEKEAERKRLLDERKAKNEEKKKEFLASEQRRLLSESEEVRLACKEEMESARDANLRAMDAFRSETEAERRQILETLSAHSAQLAAAFAESVIGESK